MSSQAQTSGTGRYEPHRYGRVGVQEVVAA
jgi:hypothetical protein